MTIKNSDLFHLDDRSREIFKRIVEEYLAKGFPIGSRTVSQMDRINLSAASIRNVMHGSHIFASYKFGKDTNGGRTQIIC